MARIKLSNSFEQRRKELGRAGEAIAANLYERQGFTIVERNWRAGRFAEIDLIAYKEEDNLMVFVEVKSRRHSDIYGFANQGFDAVHSRKQEKIVTSARIYLARKGIASPNCRFDVVFVKAEKTPASGAPAGDNLDAPPVVIQVEGAF